MRCLWPSLLTAANTSKNGEVQWVMDVRVSPGSIDLLLCPPAFGLSVNGSRQVAARPASERRAAIMRWIGPAIPLAIVAVQLVIAALMGGRGGFTGAGWPAIVAPVPILILVSLILFTVNIGRWVWVRGGRPVEGLTGTEIPLLHVRRTAGMGELEIPSSGVRIPMEQVRGVQLLHGIVDQPHTNFSLRQLVILTCRREDQSASAQWQRYLAFCDYAEVQHPHIRAVAAFAEAVSCAGWPVRGEGYRIRGWRVPETYLFIGKRGWRRWKGRPGEQHPESVAEPLGDGATLDAWRAAGFRAFDSVSEPVVLSATEPACLACGYSLKGLEDCKTCPECGADFVASPLLRS